MSKKKPLSRIKFVGKTSDAPEFLTDGNLKIDLPKDQSKTFAHEHAKRILKVAPESYKPVNDQGTIARRVNRSAETGEFVSNEFAETHPATTVAETV